MCRPAFRWQLRYVLNWLINEKNALAGSHTYLDWLQLRLPAEVQYVMVGTSGADTGTSPGLESAP